MSGNNHNITTSEAITETTIPLPTPGVVALLNYDAGTVSVTTTTFATVSGMVNQTVNIPTTKDYLIMVGLVTRPAGAGATSGEVGLQIDSATTYGAGATVFSVISATQNSEVVCFFKINLTAGNHDFRPVFRKINGGDPNLSFNADQNKSQIIIF